MTDTELMAILASEPDRGLSFLMDEYMGLVCSIVKARLSGVCGNEDMEECASDVFCDFYHGRHSFDPSHGTVKAYLCAIARNKSINIYRSAALPPEALEADSADGGFSVEEEYLTREKRAGIMREIKNLGEPDSEIILRKFYFSEPSRSIAESLNLTVSTIDTRTHRALKKLRKRLGGLV